MSNDPPDENDKTKPQSISFQSCKTCQQSASSVDRQTSDTFRNLWPKATEDNYLTLYGFRRYRTTHLLNLRFLEEEISKLDHDVFQAGIRLGQGPTPSDKLGLRHAKLDGKAPHVQDVMTRENLLRLRELLKQYDDGIIAFNNLMRMETYALADSSWHSRIRTDLNAYETYKTRLVRVDQVPRSCARDVLRHSLRKLLRGFWYFFRSEKTLRAIQGSDLPTSALETDLKQSYQHTARLAEIITRFIVAIMSGIFLVVPLIILFHQSSSQAHLATVSTCIVIFSLLVSLLSKASNEQTMAATAGYAAVLVVFLSNSSINSAH